MEYSEIYKICQPVIDWMKEHHPENHQIIIDKNGAELIEFGKLSILDKDLENKYKELKSAIDEARGMY